MDYARQLEVENALLEAENRHLREKLNKADRNLAKIKLALIRIQEIRKNEGQ